MSTLPTFRLLADDLADALGGRPTADVVVVAAKPAARDTGGTGEAEDRATDDGDGPRGPVVGPQARALAAGLGIDLDRRLARAKATGRAAEVVDLQVDTTGSDVERLLVVGLGDGSARDLRRAGAALARRTRGARRVVVGATLRSDPERLRAFVEGWGLASFRFTRRSEQPPASSAPAVRVDLLVAAADDPRTEALRRALVTSAAVHLARELASTPSNEKDPRWLARRAERAVRSDSRTSVTIRDADELAAAGFGGIVAVGQGSASPPCLIELSYRPERARGAAEPRHVVLVGKGITFDTGGLSLKPSDGMIAMKTDMAGGAAVIATMSALADLDVPVRVTALVPAAENAVSGSAQRPGDVITHYGGITSEVLNTDAEGRLVLADALAYADLELDPDVVVDLATLTGAATLGLGRRHAALYATSDRLAAALDRAAERSGERVWRMPLVEDYRFALDSDIADLAHISTDRHVGGGSITAALFLQEFVGARTWAHLDIAGPGRADSDEHEVTRGATGWGTRTLLRWLESGAA